MESSFKHADISKIRNMEISFRKQVRAYQKRRQKRQAAMICTITRTYEMKMMKISPEILNKPISKLTDEDFAYLKDIENFERPTTGSKSTLVTEDKSNFEARRVTRSKISSTCRKADKFKTPANQKPPPSAGMVTPKFNPYAPMSVLRMPKEGEIAMSMSGSPLHVSNIINESKPNVVVPLHGGRILSVMPERGLRRSEIPEIDGDLRRQLKVLNENITAILSLQ